MCYFEIFYHTDIQVFAIIDLKRNFFAPTKN